MFSPPYSSSSNVNPTLHFPHPGAGRASAVPTFAAPSEPVKRKRGRPRKYGLAAAAVASTIATISSNSPSASAPSRKEVLSPAKKSKLDDSGKGVQGFTPHIIAVAEGEDVSQKIILFMQKSKHAFCVLSASGSLCSVSLRHQSDMRSVVAYEGPFKIISLSGSFLHVEIRGASSRAGGMSIILADADGQIMGGGVGGPLIAAGHVQVFAASFLVNNEHEDLTTNSKIVGSSSKLSSELSGTKFIQPTCSTSTGDSVGRISNSRGADDHQTVGSGSRNMLLSRATRGTSQFPMIGEERDVRKMGMENNFETRFSSHN